MLRKIEIDDCKTYKCALLEVKARYNINDVINILDKINCEYSEPLTETMISAYNVPIYNEDLNNVCHIRGKTEFKLMGP